VLTLIAAGLVIALIAGFGGADRLLVTSWQPQHDRAT
jgi:hypothetical protein